MVTFRAMASLASFKEIDEVKRLEALERLEIMDTDAEPEFDELVETAAAICGVPIGLVSLLDDKRQWFKAAIGLAARETPREVAFCAHAIQQPEVMIVEDATKDDRFAANPLVTGDEHFRFYAGMPVSSPDGFPLGTLCVLDRVPRQLSPTQVAALKILGRQVNSRLELRLQRMTMERALREAEEVRERLQLSEARFTKFMDSGPFMSFLKDDTGRFLYYNKVFAERLVGKGKSWIGKEDTDLFPPELVEGYRAIDREVLDTGRITVVTEATVDPEGETGYWRTYKFACVGDDGTKLIGGVSIDVTDELKRSEEIQTYQHKLEEANHQLEELATTDSLTGLANRRVFDEHIATEFSQARRKKRSLSVLMLDIDRFKRRNDLYGHHQGDLALQQFASLLKQSVREADLAARYGGEEFVAVLPETDDVQAMQLAERILATIRSATWQKEPLTVSIGVATLQPATTSAKRLVNLADEALYVAKQNGRNRAVSYTAYYEEIISKIKSE